MTSYTKDDRRYEYSYNSDGMRTVKRVYEGDELVYTFTYIWDGDVLLGGRMEVTDADEPISIRYLYDESGELYGMDYNGNGYFAFIKNLQGDIVSIIPLDSESNVEVNMEYDAWGKPIIKQASSAAEGFLIAVMMLVTNVGYRGYFYDFETGLYYLRSRYYDPEIGRFINADDTDYLANDKSPISLNLFAYCMNNSVNDLDENGKWSKPFKVTVNFYDLGTRHQHCDISYNGGTVSYGSSNGGGAAKFIKKIIAVPGYILYKEAERSYDPATFATIKVEVNYDLFAEFLLLEIFKSYYLKMNNGFMVFKPKPESDYYMYNVFLVNCTTFVSDLLYYSMVMSSKRRLANGGKKLKNIFLPSDLYSYLQPLK